MTRSRTTWVLKLAGGTLLVVAFMVAVVVCAPWAQAGVGQRVSVSGSGSQAALESGAPSVSADGRYVAFVSAAANLVAGDTNGAYDVFVYDLQTGSISRVSVSSTGSQADGDSRSPAISGDGRCVAFLSRATNLVAGDSNGKWDVFVHTLATGATVRVGVGASGAQPDADCTRVSINGDGSVVAFTSAATGLVESDTNGVADVFVRDLTAGTTERVSIASGGAQADRRSDSVSLSADGRYVAFDSIADDLVSGDSNGKWDIFVHDRQTVTTARISVSDSGAQADGDSICPSMSADGRFVAFESEAGDLVSDDSNEAWDVFVRDLSGGGTERVSVADDGGEANDDSDAASLSGDGRYVAFASMATDLVAGDRNGMRDVYVRDRVADVTQRASISSTGTEGRDDSDSPSMAASGSYVAFESWAAELVDSDTNGCADVLVAEVGELPTVTGVSPTSGPVSGGTSVVITGTSFTDVAAVTFGGVAAEYTVDSPTQITATSPAHEAGVVQVQVVAGGIATRNTSADDFTYVAPTVYQQTDPKLTYVGSWYTSSTYWASGGSYIFTNSPGALVTASFTGTSVKLTGKKGPQYGQARVRVDGGEAEYIDFYSPYAVCQQIVYENDGLENKAHTLTLEWTGQKNESSSGYYISLDILIIEGSLGQAPAPTRYQQNDSRLSYGGSWGTSWSGTPSAGSFAYANSRGAAASIKFQGTYLVWVAKTGPQYGRARLTLDGGEATYLDLYSPGSLYQRKVYSTGLLEEGEHTLIIEWTGLKYTSSSSYYINIDALDVMGTLVQAPPPPAPPTVYQQTDPKLTYVGNWYTAFQWGASGGSFKHANELGCLVSVSFSGTSLDLVGKRSPQYGKARVSIDGGEAEYVDFYGPYWMYQELLYTTGELEDGPHTLTLEWTGEKNPASTGYLVNIDALLVRGSLRPPPELTWYQESAGELLYEGAWNEVNTPSAYDGAFYYADAAGSDLKIEFEGTHLEWFAKTSPAYGKAWVSVDDGPAGLVDLYSSETLYRQCVYSTGALEPGQHTLGIRWSGTKNPAATGFAVGVDSFCTFGSLRVAQPSEPASECRPFALAKADRTRITYPLSGPPTSVQAGFTLDGGLKVDYSGASGPMASLSVGSSEVHSVAATAVDGESSRLLFDLARYQRYRIMSLAGSESCPERIVVDVYRRTEGPSGDGSPLLCLDPGHGGSSPGTTGVVSLVPEKQMALSVGLLAADYLRERGLQVILTRQTDMYLTLDQRCALANVAEANLFVSIHGNAFYNPEVGGTETFYQEKTAEYTIAAKALATAVQNRVIQALDLSDRGARTYYVGTLGVLNGTVMPACLVELGFMSNPAEDALLTSASGQDKAAEAIADAVCDYLGWSTTVYVSE